MLLKGKYHDFIIKLNVNYTNLFVLIWHKSLINIISVCLHRRNIFVNMKENVKGMINIEDNITR